MILKKVKGKIPTFGEDCYFAENSVITGDVVLGSQCTLWYNAVIRGDVNSIRIGNKVNVQDGAVIHATYQKYATTIGDNVSIGHNAIVHGCSIGDNVLIGMGSIVMDGCIVESNSIIAAGAVLTQHTHVQAGSIYAGVPAKKVKEMSEEQIKIISQTADNYVKYASWIEEL
ncbi:gamma carbonic anhydrase family protein [Capnocytophaga canimorsus]|uniref:gamma carbonic anhydrase family protein n=1 Tax=Capnocytophaga canimorsus TaxID=28188 RepID=UPI0037CD7F99